MITRILKKYRYIWQKKGYDVIRYPLKDFLNTYQPTTTFDVGANAGQFAQHIRELGFSQEIHSFEPNEDVFHILQNTAKQDRNWNCHCIGLGEKHAQQVLNISERSEFSSFLTPNLVEAQKNSAVRASQNVNIETLDSFCDSLGVCPNNIFLKIDTQGYELPILKGAKKTLEKCSGVQLELSLSSLYNNQPPAEEVIAFMRSLSFSVYSIWPGYKKAETQQLFEADAIFIPSKHLN